MGWTKRDIQACKALVDYAAQTLWTPEVSEDASRIIGLLNAMEAELAA